MGVVVEGKGTTEALVSVPLQTVTNGGMRSQDTLCPQPHPSPLGMKDEAERSGWEERGRLSGTRGGGDTVNSNYSFRSFSETGVKEFSDDQSVRFLLKGDFQLRQTAFPWGRSWVSTFCFES